MLSNIGLEIPGAIDPNLNWKTSAKGSQWAVKRARTSVSGGRKKSLAKSSKGSEVTMDKDPRRTGDIPVSDSEKVGVSILGQHFSDSLEIVPIKKRRFLFVRSPSSPLQSSYSVDSDHLLESQPASYQGPLAYDKHHDRRFIAHKRSSLNDVIEEASDAADFSGISILAAAACNSEMVGDTTDSGSLVSKGNSCKEIHLEDIIGDESHSLCEDKERQLQSFEDLQENCNVHMETCSTIIPTEDEIKFDGSQNKKSSTGSLQNVSDKIRSSSVPRLHWDLNTDMDAWNSNCDDVVISEPLATDLVGENGNPNEKLEGLETSQCQVENGESTCPPQLGESLEDVVGMPRYSCGFIANETSEKPDTCNGLSVSNHEEDCSFPNGHILTEEEYDLDATTVSLVNSTEETKLMHSQGNNTCSVELVSSAVVDALGSSRDDSLVLDSIDKAKDNVNSNLEVETETKLSHLPYSENVSCDFNTHAYKSCPNLVQSINKPICDENANIVASNAESSSDDHCLTNADGQPIHVSSFQIKKHEHLNIDEQSGDRSPLVAENATNLMFDEDISRNFVAACGTSSETLHSDGLDLSNVIHAEKSSRAVCMSPLLLNAHQRNSPGQCNPDELISGVTCAAKYEKTTEDLKVKDDNCVGAKAPTSVSAATAMEKTDVNLVDGAVGSQEAGKSYMHSCVNFHCNHTSDVSQVDAVQVNGPEKVDLVGDDDSQFEDGEFRESVLHSWEEDEVDEGESEHVDYGSDNRDNDICESVSALPSSASFSIENMTFKERNLSDADEAHAVKDRKVALSQPSSRCSSKSDGPDRQGKRTIGDISIMDHANHSLLNRSRKQRNVIGFHNEDDNTREPSASVRMKSSGWDRLPESRRHTGDSLLDPRIVSVKQDVTSGSLDLFGDDKSLRRSSSTFRGGLSSRVARPKSSDESNKKDIFHVRLSRYNDRDSLDAKEERHTGAPKSAGWGGSSRFTQGRGRDEHWFDSPNRHGPRHHDSPGYYDTHNYARPASRNAAAAAVAKVESNGFVVARDGTLVKAGSSGSAGRVPRQSANASLRSTHPSLSRWGSQAEKDHACDMQRRLGNSREMSPDRHFSFGRGQAGKYAHEMDRDRYGRPVSHDRMESSLVAHHLATRDRSFSPRRGPLCLPHSHTGSPSRSRTRSPLLCTSPRGRSDIGMNDVPVFRRRSRSPVARLERMRSPHPRPSFEERMIVYGSASGTLGSPLHASRWVDERKDSPDHLIREDEYKRYSGRSPPVKVFGNHRFDSIDSQGRLKSNSYYRSLQSTRKAEFAGFGRGYKCDGSNDRREHGGRHELLHSMRQYNIDNSEKQFR